MVYIIVAGEEKVKFALVKIPLVRI